MMRILKESCRGFRYIRNDVKLCGISKLNFIKSEWEEWRSEDGGEQHLSWKFVAWRVVYLTFCACCVFPSIFLFGFSHYHHWFLYVTNWNILLQFLYNFLNILSLLVFWIQQRRKNGEGNYGLNLIDYCVWISFNISSTLPYVITLVYWAAVHDPNNPRHAPHLTMFSHGINAVFTLIDTLVVAIPVHVTHVVYLVAFCGTYAIFTYSYEAFGGSYPQLRANSTRNVTYIYKFLNWRESAGIAIGAVAIAVAFVSIFFYVLWLLYIFRLFLVSKFTKLGQSVQLRHGKMSADVIEQVSRHVRIWNNEELVAASLNSENVEVQTAVELEE